MASTGSAAATPAISPTFLLSAAHTPAMAEAAQAAAAAAVTQFFTKAPTFSGASGFRVYKTELKIWLRMTTVAANKQAPTTLAALTGSAKRLAVTLTVDKFFQDDGAAQLLAVLEERFGERAGASSETAFEALHACVRKDSTMEEYLVSFDEALVRCEEAGLAVLNAMQAHLALHQAGLTDMERSMTVSTATKESTAELTYREVASALMVLFPGKGGTGRSALVAQTANPREPPAPVPRRPVGGRGGAATSAVKCWYCTKNGHVQSDCRMRAKHHRERGLTEGEGASAAPRPADHEVVHLVIRAGTTGSSWDAPTGQVILDSGATSTIVGADWQDSFTSALPPADSSCISHKPVCVELRFGNGESITSVKQVILPVHMGRRRYLVAAYVLSGSLPILISRPTLASLRGLLDFVDNTLRLPDNVVPLSVPRSGHQVLNALGSLGVAHLVHHHTVNTVSSRSAAAVAPQSLSAPAPAARAAPAASLPDD